MQSEAGKSYSPPSLKKLTVEQAKEFLAIHATCGDPETVDLLKLLDEEPQERQRFLEAHRDMP